MRDFLRSPLFAIFLIVFVDVLGVGITVPVMPLFAQDQLGATAFQVGLLATVYFVVQSLAAPFLGRLSDRLGRRPVLIFSQFGTLSALLLSAWAPGLLWLFVARVLDGVTGGNISTAFAYVGDVSKPEERARAMGVINAAFGAGFMFGPAIGGYLGGHFGPRVPFLVAAAVSVLSIVLSVFRLKESRKPDAAVAAAPAAAAIAGRAASAGSVRPAFSAIARLPGVPRILVIGFFTQLAMLCFTSMWVLWADRVVLAAYPSDKQQLYVGLVFTILGVFQLITQALLVGPLVKSLGEKRMVVLGLFTRGLGWAGMALGGTLPLVFACLPFASFGSGISQPAMMALLTFAVPPMNRGQAIGVMASIEGAGRIAGPLLAGLLFERVAPGAPILVAAAISVLGSAIALTLPARNSAQRVEQKAHTA